MSARIHGIHTIGVPVTDQLHYHRLAPLRR